MNKYIEPIEKWLQENEEWWLNEPEFWLLQYDIVDKMKADNIGMESVPPILELMEKYPLVDFGTPGALTHFIENFSEKNSDWYDNLVVQSVKKCPTVHTVWLLNRIVNASIEEQKKEYLQIMENIYNNKTLHENIREVAESFLKYHEKTKMEFGSLN